MEEQGSSLLLLKQIHDAVEKEMNNRLRESSLTFTQLEMLRELNGRPDGSMTQKELQYTMCVSQPTIVGIVSRLQQKRLVTCSVEKGQGRAKRVSITPEGRTKAGDAREDAARAEDSILGCLSREERAEFCRMLRKVQSHLD